MATNVASQFSADVSNFIAEKTLPLARRQLVVYQFGDPLVLPKGQGQSYTASRYNRVPLPFQPLAEGVPPVGEQMSLQQVVVTVQQWGDKITITDVAELTIKHPIFKKAIELTALQVAETLERNTFNNLMGGTQINYVNARGSRGALLSTDVMNPHEINRLVGALVTIGAPRFMGDEQTDTKVDADAGGAKASENPRKMPHFTAVMHPLVAEDLRENSTIATAWQYSDINRLYNFELGEWGGVRFCFSNMVPTFTGLALISGTPSASGGTLATSATYNIIVTESDTQNQYESKIHQVSGNISVTGPTGSISVVLPSDPGFTYNIYIGTSATPTNLGTTPSGPTSGPLTGQAVQLAGGQTVVITGIGVAQTPPAAPATAAGTVYPLYVFGRGAYGQVVLDEVKITYLKEADKSDPLNQLRVVGWKVFYGTIILNQQFFARIESTSAFSATFG